MAKQVFDCKLALWTIAKPGCPLEPSDRLMLLALAAHASEETGDAFPSLSTLAKSTGFTRRHVIRVLARETFTRAQTMVIMPRDVLLGRKEGQGRRISWGPKGAPKPDLKTQTYGLTIAWVTRSDLTSDELATMRGQAEVSGGDNKSLGVVTSGHQGGDTRSPGMVTPGHPNLSSRTFSGTSPDELSRPAAGLILSESREVPDLAEPEVPDLKKAPATATVAVEAPAPSKAPDQVDTRPGAKFFAAKGGPGHA